MKFAIVYLEDNAEVREVICDLLEVKLKVRCLGLAHLTDFEKNASDVLQSKIALLDLDLGPRKPNGIDAFHWLTQNNYKGQVYFLTGHGKDTILLHEIEKRGVLVLEKPLSTETITKLFPKDLVSKTLDVQL